VRRTWRNHTGNQTCRPQEIREPASLEDLVDLVRRAERERTTARVVGAHNSWSDVALTEGLLAEPARLRGGLLPLDDGCLREDAGGPFARVLAGTPLRQLNPALDAAGLALPNMGGYDAQTLAGVASTSTHGSGMRFGPFPDLVVSMDVVIAGGEVVRVEPAGGITDAAAFSRARRRAASHPGRPLPRRRLRHWVPGARAFARDPGSRQLLPRRGPRARHVGAGAGLADGGRRPR
jgi:FAD/FMN-containing dehydrogenase